MAPARPRILDDSRSETSSTAPKDRPPAFGPVSASTTSKGKRVASTVHNLLNGTSSSAKAGLIGTANGAPGSADAADPNLPRIHWVTFPTRLLHTYRQAHRLQTASSHTHAHADLIFAASRTGLRSPAAVSARRKARSRKLQEARLRKSSDENGKKSTAAGKERERSSDRLKAVLSTNQPVPSSAAGANNTGAGSLGSGGSFDKQTPHALALAVRRHFNSQQVSEGDVIAKFAYVVRHGGGAGGDDKGFRLRFRP